MAKKKILLNWWYDRADLLAPFIKLCDKIDFVLIYHIKRPSTPSHIPVEVKYWEDYSTPYELLNEVAPEEVVFFNIDDGTYQIALREACRQKGIRATICDHGLRGSVIRNPTKVEYESNKHRSLLFLLSCIRPDNVHLVPLIIRLFYLKMRGKSEGIADAALRELRLADRYLCYSKINADFFINRDQVDPDRIKLIGNPGYDEIFAPRAEVTGSGEPFYLLLDQPFVQTSTNNGQLSVQEKNEFLAKIASFCESEQRKLYVKLHPEDYGQSYYLQHSNIVYLEQADIGALIYSSYRIFGFYSTLLIPALCLKRCLIFNINENPIQNHWVELGVTQMLDFFSFQPSDIDFDKMLVSKQAQEQFVAEYVYKTDGRALQRLEAYLIE